ncbi:MAG: hypothetical protein MJE68_14005 [Proteobacteria bacterium]|nr:hypothetical protein [Pseudomonadota bacterium]
MKQTQHNNNYYYSTDTEVSMHIKFYVFAFHVFPHDHLLVQNLPEFLPGFSQDVTDYSIAVGTLDPITIPATIACPTSTCYYSNYSVQSLSDFNSPLSASVSAVNVIGRGEVCTPQTEIGTN